MQYLSFNIFRRKGFKRTNILFLPLQNTRCLHQLRLPRLQVPSRRMEAQRVLETQRASSRGQRSSTNTRPHKFQGTTNGLEEHYFYYGHGLNTKWLDSREHHLSYVGHKYTANEVTSLENGGLSLVPVSKPKNVDTKAEFRMLSYYEQ